jgi:hypothetical protein
MEAPPEALSSTVLNNIFCLGFCWVTKDELLESIFFEGQFCDWLPSGTDF